MALDDGAYMRRALDLARLGWGHTAPNPMVGAVLVRDGAIVGEGYHARLGGDHAEVVALRAAGARAAGATLYVTLEPCAHEGRTPPCVDAVIAAGVRRVVVAARDPHPVARGGLERLAAAGIETTTGPEAAAARELNAPFFFGLDADRPWVTLKLALSIDGAVGDATRAPARLTGPAAGREVHRLRAGASAVAIGLGTALTDDPLLTVRDAPAPRVAPMRVVFDRTARLPLESRLIRTVAEAPVTVVSTAPDPGRASALERAGAAVIVAPTVVEALRALRTRGVRSLLLEGGPRLVGAFLDACVVDRLVIFQAPVLLGSGAEPAFAFAPPATAAAAPRLPVLEHRSVGGDWMTVYALSTL